MMQLPKIGGKERHAEQIYWAMVDWIAGMNVHPGDRLPNENELAERFGVSRPTIREALRVLEYSGLVESRRGRNGGLFVGPGPIPHIVGALRTLFLLGNRSVEQMYEARSILEVGIARLAARHVTAEQLTALDRSIEMMAQSDSSERVRAANSLFHVTLAQASGNDILYSVMSALIDLLHEITPKDVWYDRDAIALRVDNHQQILDAVRQGDEDAAATAMIDHVSEMTEQRRVRGELQISRPPEN